MPASLSIKMVNFENHIIAEIRRPLELLCREPSLLGNPLFASLY